MGFWSNWFSFDSDDEGDSNKNKELVKKRKAILDLYKDLKEELLKQDKKNKSAINNFIKKLKEKGTIYFRTETMQVEFAKFLGQGGVGAQQVKGKKPGKVARAGSQTRGLGANSLRELRSVVSVHGPAVLADITKNEEYRSWDKQTVLQLFSNAFGKIGKSRWSIYIGT